MYTNLAVLCSHTTGERPRAFSIRNNSSILQAINIGKSDDALGNEANVVNEIERVGPDLLHTVVGMNAKGSSEQVFRGPDQ